MKTELKLSVITVNKSNSKGLLKTLNSIDKEYQDKFEILIIDSESRDADYKSLIKNQELENIFFLSERDKGIYDGMNKGIKIARGKWLIFMNSGDEFFNFNSFFEKRFFKQPYDIIFGSSLEKNKIFKPKKLDYIDIGVMPINHQAIFFNKTCFLERKYNPDFKIYADLELLAFLRKNNYNFKNIEEIICKVDERGISNKISWEKRKDKLRILIKYQGLNNFIKSFFYFLRFKISRV